MKHAEKSLSFIFFLTLEDSPPRSFYVFDQFFKELGFILVPVKVDQIQSLVATSEQEQVVVIASVSNAREYKIYNEKVRGYLKYILKSKRLSLMHLSSFSNLNDQKLFAFQKNYFFIKYPMNAKEICTNICKYYFVKQEQRTVWPGGKKATLGTGVV